MTHITKRADYSLLKIIGPNLEYLIDTEMCVFVCVSDLLHVTQDVLPTVEHSSALLGVQLVDEVGGEVLIAVLVSETHTL